MKLKPLFDRVVLKVDKRGEKTQSGIFLPVVSEEKSQLGVVVAVGTGGNLDGKEVKMQVKEGDRVLFSKFAGTQFKFDEEEYLVIRQTDILGVVEK
ncbi:MAG: co-chaperone GroES [Clostridia bacterium]